MRIRTLILCLLCCVASALAKDVITKTDGTKLDVKVEEITETVIKYRKASNPTGPIYTIPLTSVETILYENGETDTFNAPVTSPSNLTPSSASDDGLIRIAESQDLSHQSEPPSDTELVRIVNEWPSKKIYAKASTYRKIGFIGGGVLLTLGVAIGIANVYSQPPPHFFDEFQGGLISGLVTGGVWCVGFNLKAWSLSKKAKEMEQYSANIFQNEICHFGDKKLTAGVDLIGNRLTNTSTLGLSVGFNF